MEAKKHTPKFIVLSLVLVVLLLINISLGQVTIPLQAIYKTLIGTTADVKDTWEFIILNFRLPKAITALLVGAGLSISGLMMQTLFRNPLAGPYVLGLSSGSSLGVALVLLGAGLLPPLFSEALVSSGSLVVASCLGSLLVLFLIFIAAKKLKDTMSVLIIGLMFSSFTGALVSVLTYFSTAEQLQRYTFWSLGSIGNLSWSQIVLLSLSVGLGLVLSIRAIKTLDALLLGENYAQSLGVNIKRERTIIFLATGILAGSITAFVGPIAFVGLAVPHLAKLYFQTSNHKVLYLATILIGSSIMLFCDVVSQMPGQNFTLPINAITSIIGAPMVIWLLIRKKGF